MAVGTAISPRDVVETLMSDFNVEMFPPVSKSVADVIVGKWLTVKQRIVNCMFSAYQCIHIHLHLLIQLKILVDGLFLGSF